MIVTIPNSKGPVPISPLKYFVIDEKYTPLVEEYQRLRPYYTDTDRFFLNYQNGSGVKPIGINKFPKMPFHIAKYLNLPNPETYTGNSFLITSDNLSDNSSSGKIQKKKF